MNRGLAQTIRTGRNVLRMVAELHLRGYQRLRIVPGESPSGTAWRCTITTVLNVKATHGAEMLKWRDHDAHYTSASGREYFDWSDMTSASPNRLAEAFIQRFPELVREGLGRDWLYVGWYAEMLQLTYPDVLPIAYGEYVDASRVLPCHGLRKGVEVPVPPPGEGLDSSINEPGSVL